jgi:hypothetical protein
MEAVGQGVLTAPFIGSGEERRGGREAVAGGSVGFNCAMVSSLETALRGGELKGAGWGDEGNVARGGLASPGAGEQSSGMRMGNRTTAAMTRGG